MPVAYWFYLFSTWNESVARPSTPAFRCSVEIAGLVKDQVRHGSAPVAAAGEGGESGFRAGAVGVGRQLKNRTVSPKSLVRCGAVKTARLVGDQTGVGLYPRVVGSEAVND